MSESWGAPAPQSGRGEPAPATQQAADAWGGNASSGHAVPSAADMFGGQSTRSFSFDGVAPIRVGGMIVAIPDPIVKRDYHDPSIELKWPDGRPKYTQPIHCQTDRHEDEDDDGVRATYLEYEKMKAVKEALKKVGKSVPEVGGTLWLEWYDMRGKTKLYRAQYSPPGAASTPPQATVAPPPDPWQGLNPSAVAELQGHGLQPHQVLPHITGRENWQSAPAAQILSVVPRPAPVQDEPPF